MQSNEFLTFNQLGSLYGLTFAVYLIMTGLVAINLIGERWLKLIALGVSILLAMVFVYLTDPANAQAYVIGIVNAFMAFLGASGLSNLVAAGQARRAPAPEVKAEPATTRLWWEKW